MKQRYFYIHELPLLSTYSLAGPCAKHVRNWISCNPSPDFKKYIPFAQLIIIICSEIIMTCILLKRKLRLGGLNTLLKMTEPINGKYRIEIQVQMKQHHIKIWVLSLNSLKSTFWKEKKRPLWPASLGSLASSPCSRSGHWREIKREAKSGQGVTSQAEFFCHWAH